MSRPVVTAIMLDELVRAGAEIRLRRDALVTPAARDWLRDHAVPVIWEDRVEPGGQVAVVMDASVPELRTVRTYLERQGLLGELIEPPGGGRRIACATRELCEKMLRGEAAKGVVFAADGAVPVCLANKYPKVRAALGTGLPAVEQACRALGLNVLVIEYPTQTGYQTRQMIERFVAGPAAPPAALATALDEIEQGGKRADR